ncbi:MAG: hypothetical protein MH204_02840 [Fimbriimonadaceae bacterium]|nr:hypothetical protein [Fimbriimonadaceae bacterium]
MIASETGLVGGEVLQTRDPRPRLELRIPELDFRSRGPAMVEVQTRQKEEEIQARATILVEDELPIIRPSAGIEGLVSALRIRAREDRDLMPVEGIHLKVTPKMVETPVSEETEQAFAIHSAVEGVILGV